MKRLKGLQIVPRRKMTAADWAFLAGLVAMLAAYVTFEILRHVR